ncbi:MAG: proline dehydrogenase family protein [Parcubacteria group bacterium]|nr:proline dehydrogenase family protein [Parcubacteria group bacterium]
MKKQLLGNFMDPVQWLDDEVLASGLTRFVSILPYLTRPEDLVLAFREILLPIRSHLPPAFIPLLLAERLSPCCFAFLLKQSLPFIASRFVAGNGLKEILKVTRRYKREGFEVNLDILGEMVLSEKEAEQYAEAYQNLISELRHHVPFGTISLSCKVSAFFSQSSATAPEYAAEKILERLTPVVEAVSKEGGHVYLDAEEYERQEIHFLVFQHLYKKFGNCVRFVLQAYLRGGGDLFEKLCELHVPETPLHVRLVRGAYWDYEHYRAELQCWSKPPVFSVKEETDKQYLSILRLGLLKGVRIVPATHNAASIVKAEKLLRENRGTSNLAPLIPEFQFLYGMGEPYGKILVNKNIPVRFYMPVIYPKGNLSHAVGYLVRRLVENRSQMSFMVKHRGKKLDKALELLGPIEQREKGGPR